MSDGVKNRCGGWIPGPGVVSRPARCGWVPYQPGTRRVRKVYLYEQRARGPVKPGRILRCPSAGPSSDHAYRHIKNRRGCPTTPCSPTPTPDQDQHGGGLIKSPNRIDPSTASRTRARYRGGIVAARARTWASAITGRLVSSRPGPFDATGIASDHLIIGRRVSAAGSSRYTLATVPAPTLAPDQLLTPGPDPSQRDRHRSRSPIYGRPWRAMSPSERHSHARR
jgi:hypothetical protein